jgi:2-haloacid dehalogenase
MRKNGNLRYTTLLFDVDNTLLNFDASEEEAFKSLLLHFGMEPSDCLLQEYHQINRSCWELFEEGKMEKDEVLLRRFEIFFSRHNCQADGMEAEAFYRKRLGNSAVLIPGALDLCRDLSREYVLYIVTNGVAETQYRRLESSGLNSYFKGIFVSEEAGSPKPKKEFFDYCFEKMRLLGMDRPEERTREMLLIGDSLTSDMRGGENAGIDTCWYNPRGLSNEKDVSVTMEVSSYEEIREVLLT